MLFLIEHWLTNKELSDLSANFSGYILSGALAIIDCVMDPMGVLRCSKINCRDL